MIKFRQKEFMKTAGGNWYNLDAVKQAYDSSGKQDTFQQYLNSYKNNLDSQVSNAEKVSTEIRDKNKEAYASRPQRENYGGTTKNAAFDRANNRFEKEIANNNALREQSQQQAQMAGVQSQESIKSIATDKSLGNDRYLQNNAVQKGTTLGNGVGNDASLAAQGPKFNSATDAAQDISGNLSNLGKSEVQAMEKSGYNITADGVSVGKNSNTVVHNIPTVTQDSPFGPQLPGKPGKQNLSILTEAEQKAMKPGFFERVKGKVSGFFNGAGNGAPTMPTGEGAGGLGYTGAGTSNSTNVLNSGSSIGASKEAGGIQAIAESTTKAKKPGFLDGIRSTTENGSIREAVGRNISNGASAVGQGIKNGASTVGQGIKNGASTVGQGIKNGASTVGQGIKNGASKFGSSFMQGVRNTTQNGSIGEAIGRNTINGAKKLGSGIKTAGKVGLAAGGATLLGAGLLLHNNLNSGADSVKSGN